VVRKLFNITGGVMIVLFALVLIYALVAVAILNVPSNGGESGQSDRPSGGMGAHNM
jgi:hypothetical protein